MLPVKQANISKMDEILVIFEERENSSTDEDNDGDDNKDICRGEGDEDVGGVNFNLGR
jgi:hypothetical protein